MIQSCCIMGEMSPRSYDSKRRCSGVKDWSRLDDQFFRLNINLVNIISNLEALPKILEDLEDDPVKATKKQIEFSTRFTRNYLCELRQKMNDIRRYLEQPESDNQSKNQSFFHLFLSSFQTVHQAFQNIEKNLKYVIFNKMPLQISEFLNCFGDLCVIANAAYWEGSSEKLLDLQHLNTNLITKLNDIEDNIRKAEIQKKEKQKTILKFKNEVKKSPPPIQPKKGNKSINFSMYKSNQVTNFEKLWKKKTRALAEAKFGNKQEYLMKTDKNKENSVKNEKVKEKSSPNDGKNKSMSGKNDQKDEVMSRPKRKNMRPVPENEMETMVQSVAMNSVTSESEMEEEGVKQDLPNNNNVVNIKTELIVKTESPRQNILEAENFPMGTVLDEAFKTMFNHIMSQVMTNIDPDKPEIVQDLTMRDSVAQEVKRSNFREDNVKLICIVEDETTNYVKVEN